MADQDKLEAVVKFAEKVIELHKNGKIVRRNGFAGDGVLLTTLFVNEKDDPKLWEAMDDDIPFDNPTVSNLSNGRRLEVGGMKYPITVPGQAKTGGERSNISSNISDLLWNSAPLKPYNISIEQVDALIQNRQIREHDRNVIELKADLWQSDYGKKICALANTCIRGRMTGENAKCFFVGGYDEKIGPTKQTQEKVEEASRKAAQSLRSGLAPFDHSFIKIYSRQVENDWFLIIEVDSTNEVVYWKNEGYEMIGGVATKQSEGVMMTLHEALPQLPDPSARVLPANALHFDKMNEVNDTLVSVFAHNMVPKPSASTNVLQYLKIERTVCSAVLFGCGKAQLFLIDGETAVMHTHNYSGLFSLLEDHVLQKIEEWSRNKDDHYIARGIGIRIIPAYSTQALREALVNAVVHCNLKNFRPDDVLIIVRVFRDRVEIQNGCYPSAIRHTQAIFSYTRTSINKLLETTINTHSKYRLIESLGSGRQKILVESLKNGKKPPAFGVEDGSVVPIWLCTIYDGITDKLTEKIVDTLEAHFGKDTRSDMIALALWGWAGQKINDVVPKFGVIILDDVQEVLQHTQSPVKVEADRYVLADWIKNLQDADTPINLFD